MLLKQMRYFVAVVACNSFTEAAEQCYISQSAVSQQIRALEEELGTKLLIRENRRFTLTKAGEYFYTRSKAVLEQVDAMLCETKRLGAGAEPQLRIGYPRCYGGLELHRAIAEFSEAHPQVTMHIVHGTHEELYDLLRNGGVDLIINDQRRAFSDAYVNFELAQCGCYAEISANHPLGSRDRVSLEDLQQLPCILISSPAQQRAEQAYYQNTLNFGGSYLFAENLEEGRLLVVSNRGFLPIERVGTLPPTDASTRRLPICRAEQQLQRKYCAFWRKDRANAHIEAFANILRRLLQTVNRNA